MTITKSLNSRRIVFILSVGLLASSATAEPGGPATLRSDIRYGNVKLMTPKEIRHFDGIYAIGFPTTPVYQFGAAR